MTRYERVFARLRARRETAFIPFAVAGDPDSTTSERVFRTFIDSGADVLEIGYPFSDPVADGPVNQRAATRAIAAGLNHHRFFALIRRLRTFTDIPFGLLCYANSVHHLGCDRFCQAAAAAGLDSLLVADMPPEEAGELLDAERKHGIVSVFIASELTPQPRMATICAATTGFVYVVSRLGPTGVQSSVAGSVGTTLQRLRRVTTLPLCVGFGLSRPEHVAAVHRAGADGAIVGSALVSMIESNLKHPGTMLDRLGGTVRACKGATRDHPTAGRS
jgi:tryptophan synthase alpha chain